MHYVANQVCNPSASHQSAAYDCYATYHRKEVYAAYNQQYKCQSILLLKRKPNLGIQLGVAFVSGRLQQKRLHNES